MRWIFWYFLSIHKSPAPETRRRFQLAGMQSVSTVVSCRGISHTLQDAYFFYVRVSGISGKNTQCPVSSSHKRIEHPFQNMRSLWYVISLNMEYSKAENKFYTRWYKHATARGGQLKDLQRLIPKFPSSQFNVWFGSDEKRERKNQCLKWCTSNIWEIISQMSLK